MDEHEGKATMLENPSWYDLEPDEIDMDTSVIENECEKFTDTIKELLSAAHIKAFVGDNKSFADAVNERVMEVLNKSTLDIDIEANQFQFWNEDADFRVDWNLAAIIKCQMLDDEEFLNDLRDAIDRIEAETKKGE